MSRIFDLSTYQYNRHLERLGLLENPFVPYNDQRYVFLLRDQRVAYQDVVSSMQRKPVRNFTFVLGNQGMGKTTLAKRLVNFANADSMLNVIGIYIDANEELIPSNLLKIISSEINIPFVKNNSDRLQVTIETLQSLLTNECKSLFLAVDGVLRNDTLSMLRKMSIRAPFTDGGESAEGSILQLAVFSSQSPTNYSPKNLKFMSMVTNANRNLPEPNPAELKELLLNQTKVAGMMTTPLFEMQALDALICASKNNIEETLFIADLCLRYLCEQNQTIITEDMVNHIVSVVLPDIRQPSLFSYESMMKE